MADRSEVCDRSKIQWSIILNCFKDQKFNGLSFRICLIAQKFDSQSFWIVSSIKTSMVDHSEFVDRSKFVWSKFSVLFEYLDLTGSRRIRIKSGTDPAQIRNGFRTNSGPVWDAFRPALGHMRDKKKNKCLRPPWPKGATNSKTKRKTNVCGRRGQKGLRIQIQNAVGATATSQ